MMHEIQHPLSGQSVKLKPGTVLYDAIKKELFDAGLNPELFQFEVEDWWDRLYGGSWMFASGNYAVINYAMRSGAKNLPLDDEVVYGKVGRLGHIVHVSELDIES